MSRRVPSWLPVFVVTTLILQSLLPAFSPFTLPVAIAQDAPPIAPTVPWAAPNPFASPLPTPDPTPMPPPELPATPDLTLHLTADPIWAEPGDVVTFTVTAANSNAAPCPGLALIAPLSAGLVNVAQSGSFHFDLRAKALIWSVGELAAGP